MRWLLRRRPVLVAAIFLIAIQIGWSAHFLSQMYFFGDDFSNMDLAIESSFGWHYLTYIGPGHLMIGDRAVVWLLVRISLYNWALASFISLACVAAGGPAAFRLLRTLFGERPAILIPLAMYLLTPLSLAGLGWWTAALELFPLQLAVLMAANAHVRYIWSGAIRQLVAAVSWVAVTLLASEKGLVVPILLLALTGAFGTSAQSWLSGTIWTIRQHWRIWSLYVALVIGYMAVFESALASSTVKPAMPASLHAVLTFAWGLVRDSLLPGALG